MASTVPSPALWVQLTQALVARELVDGFGLPERRAAALLGLAPSAISQYLSGKRLSRPLAAVATRPEARQVARRIAQDLLRESDPGAPAAARLLEGALAMAQFAHPHVRLTHRRDEPTAPPPAGLRRSLRARIAGEQSAVADCMRLAQKSRDELTRALFRQIASDSLRHAEIVASLATYLDRGVQHTIASGIRRADVDRLIAREQAAEATASPEIGPRLGGVMGVLWASMEADERKHSAILARLRTVDLLGPEVPVRRARAAYGRTRSSSTNRT
jgi:predicted transcriptional regulator/predicted nucleic acid-binding protein